MMENPERPIQRPKDREAQQAHYSGKKKQHTVKNNLLMTVNSKVVLLTPSYEGRLHDKRIADMTGYSLPRGSYLYQDSGYIVPMLDILPFRPIEGIAMISML
jgi:hypothetical protein